jgi:sulfite reductase (ferredoxin)
LAELSQAYASDSLHITTRQELQLHDVALENIIPILRGLLQDGLSTRGGGGGTVRNIIIPADSGVAKDEVFDVSPYAFALTSRLIDEPDSWLLPRKYKIAFSNTEQDTARAVFNDLGFIAVQRNRTKGFAVYVAGGFGLKPHVGHLLHEFIADGEVYFVAKAIKQLFNKYGNRKNRHAARLRFLWNSLGEVEFRKLYQHELDELLRQNIKPLVLPPPLDKPGSPIDAPHDGQSDDFRTWMRRFVTSQKQPGLYTVLIPIALGNLSNANLLSVADFLIPIGEDVVRATIDQNLQLRNIPEGLLPNVFELIKGITPLALEARLLGSAVACTGAATCKLGLCQSRDALTAIVLKLKESNLDLEKLADIRINISGCPNSCGAHITADLGFFGRIARSGQTSYPAYEFVAGAKLGHGTSRLGEALGTIAARDLSAFVADVLERYLNRQPGIGSFVEYFDKQGKEELRELCKTYRHIPYSEAK